MKYKLIFLLIDILIVLNIFSQEKGEINGRVIDIANQQPILGAVVEILELKLKTGTDDNGYFILSDIPVGIYSVQFSSIGYKPLIKDFVSVNSGSSLNLLAELEITSTDEINVEALRFEKPLDISNSFKNLSFEEIRRSPGGFEDIGRVIQTLPGVSFVNDGRNDLIVRGGSPAENLFLVDGAPIPNINHFGSQGTTGGPTSIIDLNFIREVNFITGGFSAKYGDKLSSVLDIKLREGNRNKFMGNLNLSATGIGGIFEGPFGSNKKGSWLFSVRRSYLDFIFNAAGFGFIPEYNSTQLKGVYDIDDNNILTFNFIGNLDKVRFNNDKTDERQKNEDILKNNQYGYTNSIELKSLLTDFSYTRIILSRSYSNFDYSARDANFVERFKNISEEGQSVLKAEYIMVPNNNTEISIGVEGKLINFKNEIKTAQDTLYTIDPNTGNRYILPALDFNTSNTTYKSAAYLQLTKKFIDRIKLNLGLRYDYFDFINKKSYISPRASVTFNILHNFNLNFSYGIFYQSPSYIWLVSNLQNRDLKNIRADHYIAGIEYLFEKDTRATIEVYYKKYSDYPASTFRPYFILANSGGSYENTTNFGLESLVSDGIGYAKGIEFFFQKTLSEKFYTTANLSLFMAKYTSLDGIERASDFDNGILFIANGGYLAGKGWELSSKFRFVGGRPYTPISPVDGTQLISQYNSIRLPNYYSIDIRVDKRWNFKKWTLVTYIDIQNITGKKNITNYQWNKYTREIESNKSLGVFPTIGINAMF
ncbi:MAG: TonB-dependent receptor [Ignavibacteria bacterium]|jgi:outer membrane receptor protein involved in Fe transport